MQTADLVAANGQAQVLDLGIAKPLDSWDPNETATEMRAMTPGYAQNFGTDADLVECTLAP